MKNILLVLFLALCYLNLAPADETALQADSTKKITLPEIDRKTCSDQALLQSFVSELQKPEAFKLYSKEELQEIISFSDKCLAVLKN